MFTTKGRVGASQTGVNGRMKLTSAIDAIQDCSTFWMESEPDFLRFLTANRLGMFLLFRQSDLIRLPAYGEQYHVTTSIFQCSGYSGYRNTVLYGADGSPCVKTWSIGAYVSYESGRLAKLSKQEADKIRLDPKVDMEYLDRRIVLPETPFPPLPEFPVRRGDIDFNGHMNNVRYLEAALELLPGGYPIARFRIEFKNSAKPGDIFYPSLTETADAAYILLSNREGLPYTVMEFLRK